MIQSLIDDIKDSTGTALRLTALVIAAGASLFITVSFLCAAAFVVALQHYGLVAACLAGASVFFLATLIALGCYLSTKRQARKPVQATRSAFASAMSDPMVLAAGLQILQTIGIKRLLPLLAIGGVAFGLMAQRRPAAEDDED
ncbi:MAG: hypothetical protein AB1586_13395 [Pseudomonadota bacterium]|jgi:hypothetical protein